MPLAEALATYCREPLPSAPRRPPRRCDWDRLGDVRANAWSSGATRRREIEQISRPTLPLLEEIRDHLDDQRG